MGKILSFYAKFCRDIIKINKSTNKLTKNFSFEYYINTAISL